MSDTLFRLLKWTLTKCGLEVRRRDRPSAVLLSKQATTNRLFEPGFTYPSDSTGPYTELEGEVVELGEPDEFEGRTTVNVYVNTERGKMSGWYEGSHPPYPGCRATLRVYRSGGGWYPDDIITSWSSP